MKRKAAIFVLMIAALAALTFLTAEAAQAEHKTVTFDSQGGSYVEPQTVYYNDPSNVNHTIVFPTVPIKCIQDERHYGDGDYISQTYYYFDGWFTSTDYATPWNFDAPVDQDMTLHARWRSTPNQTYAAYWDGYYTFSLINNGKEAVIDGYFGPGGDIVIPSTVSARDYGIGPTPVVRLCKAWYAWPPANHMDEVTSAVVPDSVREIEYFFASFSDGSSSYAPNGYALTDVHLGSGVKEIGNEAFFRLTRLRNINLPQGLIYLDDMALAGTVVEHFDIPNTVKHIGSSAFGGCIFSSIVIPDSVTTMGEGAFFHNPNLSSISIGSGLREIPSSCFYSDTALAGIIIPDNIIRIGSRAFGEDTSLSFMQIGNGVTTVEHSNFTVINTLIFGRSISLFPTDINDSIHFNWVHFIMMGNAPTQPDFITTYRDNIFYCAKGATGYDTPEWRSVTALYWYNPDALDWKKPALVAEYLNKRGVQPEQVQDFYPTPGTLSTCMYYTELDPRTMTPVYVPKSARDKAMQRALLQWKRPEKRQLVLEALREAGREDLIGYGKHYLIPPGRPAASKKTTAEAKVPAAKKAQPSKPAQKQSTVRKTATNKRTQYDRRGGK